MLSTKLIVLRTLLAIVSVTALVAWPDQQAILQTKYDLELTKANEDRPKSSKSEEFGMVNIFKKEENEEMYSLKPDTVASLTG